MKFLIYDGDIISKAIIINKIGSYKFFNLLRCFCLKLNISTIINENNKNIKPLIFIQPENPINIEEIINHPIFLLLNQLNIQYIDNKTYNDKDKSTYDNGIIKFIIGIVKKIIFAIIPSRFDKYFLQNKYILIQTIKLIVITIIFAIIS